MDINHLELLDPENHPNLKVLIERLQQWDRKAIASSMGAGTFAVFYDQLRPFYQDLPEPIDDAVFPLEEFEHLSLGGIFKG